MDPFVHMDFETRSTTDLVKSGVYRYAEDPNTAVWLLSYEFNMDGKVWRWYPGGLAPIVLLKHIANGGIVKAHNALFERTIWNRVVRRLHPEWPEIRIEQMDCTMARAAAIAHPQSLDGLGAALGLAQQKDKQGHALMMKMSRPRKIHPNGRIEWWDQPENIERLGDYCDQDVRTETEADLKLPPLSEAEKQIWWLDQVINDRGVPIDLEAVTRAQELTEFAKKRADSEMRKLTGRTVPKCSNDRQLIAWVNSQGIPCDTVKKGVQEDLIFMADLNENPLVREVIELRRASKKTSTAKYAAMLKCVSKDGRIRGLLNYHGASTGRWAGRLVQPQNFPRLDYEEEGHVIEWLQELLHNRALTTADVYETITAVYGPTAPLSLLSRALRSMFKAPEGEIFVGGDFSNIEGRMNAWFAGEEWKLQAFRDYDAGTGDDIYKLAYAKSFGVKVEDVSKADRQIGKVEELALGYQGSVGAFITMGETYNLNPYALAKSIEAVTPASLWDETAAQYYMPGRDKHDLKEREWTAIKVIVDSWRKANPAIVQSWWDLQDAAVAAVAAPGQFVTCLGGKVQYFSDGRCLWCVLPGGQLLCYASPEIITEKVERVRADGTTYETIRRKVRFMGVNSQTKQWTYNYLYGGLQCENVMQAASRGVMVYSMFAAERAGFPLVLTIHDELLSLVRKGIPGLDDKGLKRIMSVVPPHYEGLPLAAASWQDERYVK